MGVHPHEAETGKRSGRTVRGDSPTLLVCKSGQLSSSLPRAWPPPSPGASDSFAMSPPAHRLGPEDCGGGDWVLFHSGRESGGLRRETGEGSELQAALCGTWEWHPPDRPGPPSPAALLQVLELRRPTDSRLEHVDFECLFTCLSVRQLIRIFASLLLERRVIFVADKLR